MEIDTPEVMDEARRVTITVAGLAGNGKTTIALNIVKAIRALGIPCEMSETLESESEAWDDAKIISSLSALKKFGRINVVVDEIQCKMAVKMPPKKAISDKCKYDTDGDGNCGRPACPTCGILHAVETNRT